ncbi:MULTISPECIES: hypothetical protein [Sphingomonas]|uniref:ACT domain-containing protein n=1 Tax=Sphingomonas molluscorum TaxID=418184 RepID=A0ABU8Q0B2_9SPHN|nr:hypothetical protein [Sphingomonas sp. JUb134]MBM7404679.1 acetolactate synthase regulatory subunit [Sphingomonas sp. JUb134]
MRVTVTGAASTSLLLRVVNLVALHELPFVALAAAMEDDGMAIRLELAGAAPPAEASLEKLRALVDVASVEVTDQPGC